MTNKLSVGSGNAKLNVGTMTVSLPAGYSCPFAKNCLSKANRLTGKIKDGPHATFRCFAASEEAPFTSVRNSRWKNYDALKKENTSEKMALLIQKSLLPGLTLCRVHPSGDFFNEKYFLAWLNVAYNNPHIIFYGYTKAIIYLIKYKKVIPSNFRFTASFGGTHDHLIKRNKLKSAEVVFSPEEAYKKKLEIDHDDSLAIYSPSSFSLLIHGTQPMGSFAASAKNALTNRGIFGYGKNNTFRKAVSTFKFSMRIDNIAGKVTVLPKVFVKGY